MSLSPGTARRQRFWYLWHTHRYMMVKHVMAGGIGLYNIGLPNKPASIGYWLDAQSQGNGIITRCCQTLIRYGFTGLQLNHIEIRCGTDNLKSQAIPERLHFKNEGTIRQAEFVNNQFIDQYIYSLLKEEWKNGVIYYK